MTDGTWRALERGMELIAKLPEEGPDEMNPQIHAVFEDLRSTLRVPVVNLLFRALASYPSFLEGAWFHVRPHLRTRAFELEADRLRAEALLTPVPDGGELVAAAGDALEQVRSFTETYHYVLPKLLMIASAIQACLPRRDAGESPPPMEGLHDGSGLLPLGVARGTVAVPLVHSAEVAEPVRNVFEEIKRRHHHPAVASYYRALGNWPRVLEVAWQKLKPQVDSVAFAAQRERLIVRAERVSGWVEPFEPEVLAEYEVSPAQEEELRALLLVFRLRTIPDLLLDVSLIAAMLEGPDEARRSRFSAAAPGNPGASPL